MTDDPRKEWAEGLLRDATPGPWAFDGEGSNDLYTDYPSTADDLCILTPEDKVTPDDAALIAASPDLAAAVISLAEEVERLRSTLIAARAEVDRWGYGDFHWGETPRDEGVLSMLARIDAALSSHPSEPEAP